jgi:hypothetical protein
MATDVKQEQSEEVKQHHRMAAGAWIEGDSLQERGSATMPEANSDHGNFGNKGVDKDNA